MKAFEAIEEGTNRNLLCQLDKGDPFNANKTRLQNNVIETLYSLRCTL